MNIHTSRVPVVLLVKMGDSRQDLRIGRVASLSFVTFHLKQRTLLILG